jgi:branched-chain amino acid transport system ATP-binding protein
MSNGHAVIEAVDLTVRFGGLTALEDVSIRVERGEIYGLVGPNGAGKTTLLNAIGGVFKPYSGAVMFQGRDVTYVPLHKRASLGIGRTFQGVELFADLTVQDNLMIGCHPLMRTGIIAGGLFWGSARREEIEQRLRVEEQIEFFELERYRKRRVGSLSYGVQKIVGVARSMCSDPRLLLLDEVASGLNREEKEDLARFMLRLKHTRAITMIWVEHDLRMVAELVDQVAVLAAGRLIKAGSPNDVLRDPAVQEVFIGSPRAAAKSNPIVEDVA